MEEASTLAEPQGLVSAVVAMVEIKCIHTQHWGYLVPGLWPVLERCWGGGQPAGGMDKECGSGKAACPAGMPGQGGGGFVLLRGV